MGFILGQVDGPHFSLRGGNFFCDVSIVPVLVPVVDGLFKIASSPVLGRAGLPITIKTLVES